MKKFYYSLFAAASMMLAVTSCSQEEDFVQSSSEMTTFSVQLDGATQSRTAGDGKTVDKLYYAVYSESTGEVVYPAGAQYGTAKKEDGGWKLDLPLMKSETYDILFWAQKDGSGAYEFTNLKEVTVKYDGVLSNKEDRDAFFNALDGFKASGSEHTIVLRRPFAQLNVATTIDDWTKAKTIYNSTNNTTGVNPVSKSAVTVSALATKFNVLTGEASVPTTGRVTFGANTLLDESIKIKRMVEGVEKDVEYKLLAMNYLLPKGTKKPNGLEQYNPEEGKENTEVEFTLYKGTDDQIVNVKVPATPIQRNWRTNIIGDLLTGEGFDVVIEEGFDNEENQEIEISADGIVKDADGIYHITTTEGLWNLARLVNNGSQSASTGGRAATVGYTFEGMTFVLDCDIDLAGAEWTPIGSNGAMFSGTFDGNGKTVSNFKVDVKENGGLFGNVQKSTIKDLKVQTANIKSTHYAGGIAAHGVCAKITGCTVEDITITVNPSVKIGNDYNGDKAGGIIGYLCADGGDASLMNCKANKVTITAYRDFGGIVGYTGKSEGYTNNPTISGNSVGSEENSIVLVIDNSNNYKNYTELSQYNVGDIIGRNNGATGENTTPADEAVQIVFTGADQYPGYYQDAEGNYIATEDLGITNLIKEDVTDINLADGSFKMPNVLAGKTLTFAGSRNAELDLTPVQDSQNTGANLTFSGITVKYGTQIYKGLKHTNSVTYNDCAINGLQFLYAPTTFTNCDLNSNGAEHCVWTYGADEVTFTNCTFTYGDRAVNCYSDQSGQATEATFTDCTFTKVAGKPTSGAIETNSSLMTGLELTINNCKVNEGDLWWISSYDELNGANTVVTVDGTTILGYDNEGNRIVYVSSDKELDTAINNASKKTDVKTILTLATGTYSENINLTVATRAQTGDLVFKAAEGAAPVIAGTVTLGYRNQGVGATMWDGNVTFEGITFDHANAATHSLDVQDVKSLTLKNCKIVGDGEYGIGCARGNASTGSITGCTFENAGMQLLGNFATGLVIDNCDFNQSCVNVQAGNSVTIQNCRFDNKLTSTHVDDSFYLIRSNSTPITVKGCTINIDSDLTDVASNQAKWGILWNRGTTNWTVENVAITMSDAAMLQTELKVTACTSTGVINHSNLTVNGSEYIAEGVLKNTEGEYELYKSAGISYDFGTEATINLLTDIEGTFVMKSGMTINGGNYKLGSVNLNGAAKATLKNIKFDAAKAGNGCDGNGKLKQYANIFTGDDTVKPGKGARNLVIEGCTFEGKFANGGVAIAFTDQSRGSGQSGDITIKGCTFNTQNGYYDIYAHYSGSGYLNIEGNTFDSTVQGLPIYLGRYQSSTPVVVKGNAFNTVASFEDAAYIQAHSTAYTVSFDAKDNTFDN